MIEHVLEGIYSLKQGYLPYANILREMEALVVCSAIERGMEYTLNANQSVTVIFRDEVFTATGTQIRQYMSPETCDRFFGSQERQQTSYIPVMPTYEQHAREPEEQQQAIYSGAFAGPVTPIQQPFEVKEQETKQKAEPEAEPEITQKQEEQEEKKEIQAPPAGVPDLNQLFDQIQNAGVKEPQADNAASAAQEKEEQAKTTIPEPPVMPEAPAVPEPPAEPNTEWQQETQKKEEEATSAAEMTADEETQPYPMEQSINNLPLKQETQETAEQFAQAAAGVNIMFSDPAQLAQQYTEQQQPAPQQGQNPVQPQAEPAVAKRQLTDRVLWTAKMARVNFTHTSVNAKCKTPDIEVPTKLRVFCSPIDKESILCWTEIDGRKKVEITGNIHKIPIGGEYLTLTSRWEHGYRMTPSFPEREGNQFSSRTKEGGQGGHIVMVIDEEINVRVIPRKYNTDTPEVHYLYFIEYRDGRVFYGDADLEDPVFEYQGKQYGLNVYWQGKENSELIAEVREVA